MASRKRHTGGTWSTPWWDRSDSQDLISWKIVRGRCHECRSQSRLRALARGHQATIIHRRDEFRASKIMQQRAFDNPKIDILWNHTVTEINGVDRVESIEVTDTVTGAVSTMDVTGVFIAIGHRPNTDLFTGVLDMDETGYLETVPGSSRTNIEGVFACGDVQDHTYRQAITAAGSGCMAAIDAERWLETQHA